MAFWFSLTLFYNPCLYDTRPPLSTNQQANDVGEILFFTKACNHFLPFVIRDVSQHLKAFLKECLEGIGFL